MVNESTALVNGHVPITKENVEDAIRRFKESSDPKELGKLVVMNYQNIHTNHNPQMGFWGIVDGTLMKVAFDEGDPDRDKCRHFARAILSGDEIIGVTPTGYPIIAERNYASGRGYV